MKKFEMANTDDPESIIMATQRSLVEGLRKLFRDVSTDVNAPGLTWKQLDETLEVFGEKRPTIIIKTGNEVDQ